VADNLYSEFEVFRPLPDHRVVRLNGPDAVAFAQAQFANDVVALADGHWQWSAWLTAKGRTIAAFALLRTASDEVMLVLADADADEIASQLQRFVFRRKLKISSSAGEKVTAAFTSPSTARGAELGGNAQIGWELDMGSDALPRTLRLLPDGTPGAEADAAFTAAWRQADLRYGLPRLSADQREHWTPQQLGLDRLGGYSVKKGCYPGQEIVARTHFLGKAKRALQLLQLSADVQPGAEVRLQDAPLGTVACVAGDLALAVLPLEVAEGAVTVTGEPAQRLPLLDGLAR